MLRTKLASMVLLFLLLTVLKSSFEMEEVRSEPSILFFDDFNDGNADGWTQNLGPWSVVNGEYFISIGLENAISSVNQTDLTDCIIEAKLRFNDSNYGYKACIVFRYSDNTHYYAFEISSMYDSVALTRYTPTNPDYGIEFNSTGAWGYLIEPNTNYLLKVIVQGTLFTCFIDDKEVVSGIDNNYSTGKAGLFARRADAFFDDFKVSEVEIHDVAVTSISPSQTMISQNHSSRINLTLANQGNVNETFNVTLYAEPQPVVNTTGLVGYWNLDEGSGILAADSSGNNNSGILQNGPVWVDGKHGTAVKFDGIDDYVAIPDLYSTSPTELTVSAWINSSLITTWWRGDSIIHNCRNGEFGLQLVYSGVICFGVKVASGAGAWDVRWNPSPNEWHQIVGTWKKGDSMKLYVDGTLVNQTAANDEFLFNADWLDASIGSLYRSEAFFNGTIDEVMVYTRALSEEEVKEQYSQELCVESKEVTLASYNSATITFVWNTTGFARGNYAIEAVIEPVLGETNLTNNSLVYEVIFVSIPGDINGDDSVDIFDVATIAGVFGSRIGDANWRPNADINSDDIIDIFDLVFLAVHFGDQWTPP